MRAHVEFALPSLLFALSSVGCPFEHIAAGEGLQVSGPSALPWEGGLHPRDEYKTPPYAPVGLEVRRNLEDPWSPIVLPARKGHCYSVELLVGTGGFGSDGPLSDGTRAAKPEVVLRNPKGEIVARATDSQLAICNHAGDETLTVDLVAASALPTALGKGPLRARMYERELTAAEAWEFDAHATPLFAGGGIALEDGVEGRTKKGISATRSLAAFEALSLGAVAPSECNSVAATLASGATPNPELSTFDVPLVYSDVEPAPGASAPKGNRLAAHKVVAGRLVAQEICNYSLDPIPMWLVSAPRTTGLSLGAGDVKLEVYTRPLVPSAAKKPFLDGGLHPNPAEQFTPRGEPTQRRLDAFEPLPIEVASGECLSLDIHVDAGATISKSATGQSHLFAYEDVTGKGRPLLAVVDAAGAPAARTFCNLSRDPWKLTLILRSRDGKPAGKGTMTVQLMTRPSTAKDG
ncbi:MAG: hypothetical protein U0271_30425 [Polyangiaceae bacterium]